MPTLRQDWIDEVTSNWKEYSGWDSYSKKWRAIQNKIQGMMGCSQVTARKLELFLNYQILPKQSPPENASIAGQAAKV